MNNEFKRMQKLAGLITENVSGELSTLEKMLQNHDWTYRMSDDRSNYSRGAKQEQDIMKLVQSLGQEGQELYNQYKKKYAPNMEEGVGAYEYEKGKEVGEKIEKKKMSKSKLRDKIREMVLAEMDGAAVEAEDYDFVNEYVDDPRVEEVIQMLQSIDVDGETMEYILRQVGMEDQMANQLVHNKTELGEAKKKKDNEVEDEDIDIEDVDVDTETPDMETGGENAEIDNIQSLLDQLQDAAEQLGDEKLLKQVGNTITFFTRQHVAEKPELNETADGMDRTEFMEGIANVQDLRVFKTKLRILTTEWMNEGFDKDDVVAYVEEFINEI